MYQNYLINDGIILIHSLGFADRSWHKKPVTIILIMIIIMIRMIISKNLPKQKRRIRCRHFSLCLIRRVISSE